MDWLIVIGTLCIGLLIGSFVGYFLNEADEMSDAVLRTSVSILAGGGVVALFGLLAPGGVSREVWFYPIGLLVGFVTAPFSDRAFDRLYDRWGPPERASARRTGHTKKKYRACGAHVGFWLWLAHVGWLGVQVQLLSSTGGRPTRLSSRTRQEI
jgi:hypothetical protein